MLAEEIEIDSFAGGGGASYGISRATGRPVFLAINHDADAIAMHAANHPETKHVLEDVWKANPLEVTEGRPVGLLWLSPDCKHFSRAKGSKPVEKKIRSLAWVAVRWALQVRPRVICLENVREFADWGPLVPSWRCESCRWRGTDGQVELVRKRNSQELARSCPRCNSTRIEITTDEIPDPNRKGLTFRKFCGRLRGLGYELEYRNLDAADYGAPTHRRRLFLVARNDGERIVWPDATHGSPEQATRRSLFGALPAWRTAAECIDWSIPCPSIFERKKPLAPATLKRIAHGIKRYVLDNPKPFVVRYNGSKNDRDQRGQGINAPLATLDTSNRFAVVSPVIVGAGGSEFSSKPVACDRPLGVVKTDDRRSLVTAFLAKHFGGVVGIPADVPTGTVTATDHHSLVTAHVTKFRQNSVGTGMDKPLDTITSGAGAARPAGAAHAMGIVTGNLVHLNHGDKQWSGLDDPARTVTTGNHAALVYSFLTKYFGTAVGQAVESPMHTATSKDRLGVVTVTVDGEPFVIVDIGMRMLAPRELARAQGFPEDYQLTGTKSNQVARIGNSVCPPVAEALVRANYTPCVRDAAEVFAQ